MGTKNISSNYGTVGNSQIYLDGTGDQLPLTFTYFLSNITSGGIINDVGNNTVGGAIQVPTGGGNATLAQLTATLSPSRFQPARLPWPSRTT